MESDNGWLPVYRETLGPLYAFVSRRAGGARELAEDVTQETWLRALDHWKRHGVPEEPLAWLKTVARNLLLNYYKRKSPVSADPVRLDGFLQAREEAGPDLAALVQWGLSRLRPGPAALLEAFHFDNRSVQSIAEERGLSERAVEGRLRRARQALRSRIESHLQAPENMQ